MNDFGSSDLNVFYNFTQDNVFFFLKYNGSFLFASPKIIPVKPFLTSKGNLNQKDTVLSENDVLITKQDEVCEIFNNFFVNVAKNIGNNQINVDGDHPSILEITNNHPYLTREQLLFFFSKSDFVEKLINKEM